MKRKVRATFIVKNAKGLHTRPTTEIVKCATAHEAQVTLYYKDFIVNAKSILGILMMAVRKGAVITVEAVGEDSRKVVDEILKLAENEFYMSY